MAKFAGKTVAAIHQLSVDHNARAYTGAQGEHDEILHATRHTIGHLANGCGIGIVGDGHWHTEPLAEHAGQRHDAIVSPRNVGGVFYCTFIIIGIGGSDAHGFDFLHTAHLVDDDLQCLHGGIHIITNGGKALCLDGSGGLDVATAVNNTKNRVGTPQIQSDNVRFQCLRIHDIQKINE